jgi:hypothetical protein
LGEESYPLTSGACCARWRGDQHPGPDTADDGQGELGFLRILATLMLLKHTLCCKVFKYCKVLYQVQ